MKRGLVLALALALAVTAAAGRRLRGREAGRKSG